MQWSHWYLEIIDIYASNSFEDLAVFWQWAQKPKIIIVSRQTDRQTEKERKREEQFLLASSSFPSLCSRAITFLSWHGCYGTWCSISADSQVLSWKGRRVLVEKLPASTTLFSQRRAMLYRPLTNNRLWISRCFQSFILETRSVRPRWSAAPDRFFKVLPKWFSKIFR